jgi:hypothetical protein
MTDKEYKIREDIKSAIKSFDSDKLYDSATRFFNVLDYRSNKTDRIKPNNFNGFLDAFNISSSTVNKEKALSSHWKQAEFIFQVADSEVTRIQSLFDTGDVDTNEYQSFLFFAIQLKEETYKRSELVKITREVNLPFKMPAIIIFHYGNKLTLSIIDRRLHKRDTSKDVLDKVTVIKDIDITNPQRAHIEILYDLSIDNLYKQYEFHTFAKLHEAWKATLNVSELNKNFYRELSYWYFWAIDKVKFPDDEMKEEEARNPVNVIRLITRLIFVWFLKEKNLIPDELFNKQELDKILDYKEKTGSTYYKAILQNLFFATLNTEMNKDVKDKEKISRTFVKRNTGIPHYFRYNRYIKQQEKFQELMDNIPFLNGGLFECLDKRFKDSTKDIFIDGFSQQLKNESQLQVPDYLFFSDEYKEIDLNETFHTTGKKYKVRGLIDILNNYKFTIEENTPVEEEVALDPELLGKVFENLLASYNEETKTTARKLTGSFYTPREIVNYMVDESLKLYLKNNLEEKGISAKIDKRLQQLFSYTGEPHLFADKKEVNAIIEAIDNCKILDPACGSGAFPMGILHKLVFILNKIDPNNKLWKLKQYAKAIRDEALAEKMEDDKNRETTLKEIAKRKEDIEKAFDTNNHELDYARKIFLIENGIYGVDKQPIAIQIAKLRFFIALIVDQKVSNMENEHNRGIRPLPNLETKFVAADTLVGIEEKQQLTLIDPVLEIEIKQKEKDIHEVRERHFRARTPETKEKYRERDKILRDELAYMLEEAGLFSPTNSKRIAQWNPYDQNNSADFFYKEWMFSMNEDFNIIIGNPPYIEHKKLKSISGLLKEQYDTYSGTADIYVYFYEKGIKLLNPGGVLCYITSNKFFKTSYGEKLREFLTKRKIEQLIDFTEVHVFDALVASCIVITSEKTNKNKVLVSFATDELTNFDNLREFISKNHLSINQETLGKDIWQLQSDDKIKLKIPIEKNGTPIYKIKGVTINRGITTGYNPAFIISTQKKNDLLEEDKKNNEIIKPALQGRNIKKWFAVESNEYLIQTNFDIDIPKKYPSIFEYLKTFKKELETRSDQGKKWWNLRPCKYYSDFEKEKIIWGLTADKWAFAYDDKGNYLPSNGYILTSRELPIKYILSILNSKLLQFYFSFIGIMTAGGAYTLKHETIKEIPVKELQEAEQIPFITLTEFILFLANNDNDVISDLQNQIVLNYFEQVLNGCVYELYFPDEMKKAKVDILKLVESDLHQVKNLPIEKAITTLYEHWQQSKNEIRARLMLMSARCPDTIGVIEESVT